MHEDVMKLLGDIDVCGDAMADAYDALKAAVIQFDAARTNLWDAQRALGVALNRKGVLGGYMAVSTVVNTETGATEPVDWVEKRNDWPDWEPEWTAFKRCFGFNVGRPKEYVEGTE